VAAVEVSPAGNVEHETPLEERPEAEIDEAGQALEPEGKP